MKFTLDSFVNRNAAVWAELMRYLTSSSNKEFEARVVSWMQAFNVRGIGNQVVPVRHTLGQELLDLMRVCTTSPLMPMTKVKIMVETAADIFTTNTMVEHVSAYLAHRIVQDLLVEYSLKEDELAGAEILGRSTYELYLTLTNIIENHGLIHADIRIVDKDAEAVSELMHKLDILRQDLSLRKKEVTLAVSTHPQRESSEQAEELILDDAELTLGALPDKQIAKEMLPDEKVRLLLSRYIEEIQRIQVLCAYARVALSPVESHVSLQKMVVLYREIMGHLIEQSEYAAELNESGSEENNSRGKDDTEIATKERLLEPCDFAEFAQVFKDIYQIQTALTSKGIDLQQSRVELKEEKRKLEVNNRECISSEEKIKQNIEEKINTNDKFPIQ